MGAVKPVGQLYGSPTALTSQYLAWDRYCTYVVQTPRVERRETGGYGNSSNLTMHKSKSNFHSTTVHAL